MLSWYYEAGPEADVVFSSRLRFARNLKGIQFPHNMSEQQAQEVIETVKTAVIGSSEWACNNFKYIDISKASVLEKYTLMEKHLISPNLVESKKPSGVILSNDEKISIMINEEDHLRIQCLGAGMQIDEVFKTCIKMEELIEERVDFAFSKDLGYLTCCPTNLGTGLRASIMLHLPALVMTGYIKGILEACSKIGIAVRGLYGENTEASGSMFQVSNQVTLGVKEDEVVANIKGIVGQIIEQERAIRKELHEKELLKLEDRVFRSLGILGGARIISTEESMKLLSDVRLGVEMGIINNIKLEALNKTMLHIQPAMLQGGINKQINSDEMDAGRAEVIRNTLLV